MSIKSIIGSIQLPSGKEIINVPKKIKDETRQSEIETIIVRLFNSDFSKKSPNFNGRFDYSTSPPLIYFANDSLAVIYANNSSYIDEEDNKRYIDVCSDNLYDIKKDVNLVIDMNKKYRNDIKKGKINQSISEDLMNKTGLPYYLPVVLANIPREVINIRVKEANTYDSNGFIELTQNILTQFGTIEMLRRMQKPSNNQIIACALIFIPIGVAIGSFISIYLMG